MDYKKLMQNPTITPEIAEQMVRSCEMLESAEQRMLSNGLSKLQVLQMFQWVDHKAKSDRKNFVQLLCSEMDFVSMYGWVEGKYRLEI